MAISLNDHETRIKKLEQGGTLPAYSGEGWYDFPGGLQIRMGITGWLDANTERSYTLTFAKAFSNAAVNAYITFQCSNPAGDNAATLQGFTASTISLGLGHVNTNKVGGYIRYIAIGY